MNDPINRRGFIGAAGALGLAIGRPVTKAAGSTQSRQEPESIPPGYPHTDPAVVREIVGVSHNNFDRVRELVTQRPELAKATWDWGFGDWESALGAASHTGGADIARFLMEHGARPNIFTFTMLGEMDVVKGMIEAMPGIQRTLGPHGITLLQHARVRARRSDLDASDRTRIADMVAYLESVEGADEGMTNHAITDDEKGTLVGEYVVISETPHNIAVTLNRNGALMLSFDGEVARGLARKGDFAFSPAGAPSVTVAFEIMNGIGSRVTIDDGQTVVHAERRR